MDFYLKLKHNADEMLTARQKSFRQFFGLFCLAIFSFSQFNCSSGNLSINENKARFEDFPPVILWAWERPENLEFIDVKQFGVAFLAQTLVLQGDEVIFRPRRQPLKVPPEAKLIAVTRIEAEKNTGKRPALSQKQQEELIRLVLKTLELKNVSAIQIDFDAAVSERDFYRRMLADLQRKLPENAPLSITALASFCVGDRWFRDLPVDEAVPMIFRMGADDKNIKSFLANGGDFREPLCRAAYGISTDEPFQAKLDNSRRLYIFNSNPQGWVEKDLLPFQTWSQK